VGKKWAESTEKRSKKRGVCCRDCIKVERKRSIVGERGNAVARLDQ